MYLRIRRAREQMGYTREQFAEKLDVSVSYLAELERGKTGLSVKMLLKICSLLGCPPITCSSAVTGAETSCCWSGSAGSTALTSPCSTKSSTRC